MNKNYRKLIRKEAPPRDFIMSAPSPSRKPLNRSLSLSSTSSSSTITSISTPSSAASKRSSLENLLFLNSIKVNYPVYKIPKDLARFVPDAQLLLIPSLLTDDSEDYQDFITKKKYSTNVDERTFLTVFEYKINENWIIWDYSTGYVFFTGLWKSCGNSKTDIVKLLENFPNLSTLVRRVRGGFLKIQGTWLPFDVVKTLAKNFCFNIRYCLIPIFGEEFPDQCLKPNDKNFGKLVDLNNPAPHPQIRRRRRSSNNNNTNNTSTSITKSAHPRFKKRSKSDNYGYNSHPKLTKPILELEEVLMASKSLHDLSINHTTSSNYSFTASTTNFNYGGFIWSWLDENNLRIVGRENDEAILDDNENYSSSINNSTSSIPKSYNGIDTILKAANQLVTPSGPSTGSSLSSRAFYETDQYIPGSPFMKSTKKKMDITELLS